jgi:hypothetical protein
MSQVLVASDEHIVLGPEAVFAGFATYASDKQPTFVLEAQRPAPCGHTQLVSPRDRLPVVHRPSGISCRSHITFGAAEQRAPVRL